MVNAASEPSDEVFDVVDEFQVRNGSILVSLREERRKGDKQIINSVQTLPDCN